MGPEGVQLLAQPSSVTCGSSNNARCSSPANFLSILRCFGCRRASASRSRSRHRLRRWEDPLPQNLDDEGEGPRNLDDEVERVNLVVRHVIIFGHGHGLQRAIIDESQHRTPERLIMAQH